MLKILLIILQRKKYLFITIVTTLIISSLIYYFTVINVFNKSLLIYAVMNGLFYTVLSLISGLLIAILFGFYLALLIFRREISKTREIKGKATGLLGLTTGFVAAGCPTCGVPVLALAGFPLGLLSLPFKGLEIRLVSISFLLLSIFLISKNIKHNLICQSSIQQIK